VTFQTKKFECGSLVARFGNEVVTEIFQHPFGGIKFQKRLTRFGVVAIEVEAFPLTNASKPSHPNFILGWRREMARAFSLIEVAIALGIFAFSMIPIIGLVSSGMKILRNSMDDTIQVDIARKTVGEAMRVPYTNLTSAFDNKSFYFDDEGVQQASSNAQTIFVASHSVANPPSLVTADTNIAQLLRVTVRHFADTNNKTVYSQLILNTAQ
jgi:uncharacterized protein (TIGR02598 family)